MTEQENPTQNNPTRQNPDSNEPSQQRSHRRRSWRSRRKNRQNSAGQQDSVAPRDANDLETHDASATMVASEPAPDTGGKLEADPPAWEEADLVTSARSEGEVPATEPGPASPPLVQSFGEGVEAGPPPPAEASAPEQRRRRSRRGGRGRRRKRHNQESAQGQPEQRAAGREDIAESGPGRPPGRSDRPAPRTVREVEDEDGDFEDEGVKPSGDRLMLINAADTDECRIAVVHQNRLEELFIERASAESHVGNIYKGRVTNVEPSIQAAFIDFGLPKNGFLHISDLQPQYFPNGRGQMEEVGRKTPRRERPPIQKCLRRGQEVLVQIINEGIGTKGPTLTT